MAYILEVKVILHGIHTRGEVISYGIHTRGEGHIILSYGIHIDLTELNRKLMQPHACLMI